MEEREKNGEIVLFAEMCYPSGSTVGCQCARRGPRGQFVGD